MILDKVAVLWSDPGTASVCALYAGVVGAGLAKEIKEHRHAGHEPEADEGDPLEYQPHDDSGWGCGIDRAG